jgi:hypothetical protein
LKIHEIDLTAALLIIVVDAINNVSIGIKDGAAISLAHE